MFFLLYIVSLSVYLFHCATISWWIKLLIASFYACGRGLAGGGIMFLTFPLPPVRLSIRLSNLWTRYIQNEWTDSGASSLGAVVKVDRKTRWHSLLCFHNLVPCGHNLALAVGVHNHNNAPIGAYVSCPNKCSPVWPVLCSTPCSV